MITFEDLKQKWAPEITKRAVELAEGFCFSDDYTHRTDAIRVMDKQHEAIQYLKERQK